MARRAVLWASAGTAPLSGTATGPPAATVEGRCGLCLETKQLLDSHFVPRALYKLLRSPAEANPHPIVVGPEVAMKTPKQASTFFLCSECEQRFNTGSEAWVLSHCWRSEKEFALQAALKAARPVHGSPTLAVYDADDVVDVDARRLVYFAASVFWRGAARKWGKIAGHAPVKLELGPYEEGLRKFLVGASDLPEHVVMIVTVSASTQAGKNEAVIFPWLKHHEAAARTYQFVIPGITLTMVVGKGIPSGVRSLCTWRSTRHRLYMSATMEDSNLRDMARLLSRARPVGALK